MGGWSLDKKIISIYMGNPDNSNHAELELPATPWEMVDAMDRLRLSEGQEPYWQVEDMGRYEFLAPHLDGYDLYQFNALAEKLRTFGDVDAVAFEGLVQMELNKLYQNNGGDLTLRRVLDLAYSVDCCHVVPGITDDAALGQFYVENDFLPDLATVPDSVLEMLDYEDTLHHNCVFVGVDENGEARHAHLRSTNSQGKVFRINVEGSEAKHSFHKDGTDCSLYVFEAPIDLLSHITLYPAGWLEHSYVACCGTSVQPVLERLRQNPKLNMVYLCLDNDEAGEDACESMMEVLDDLDVDVERLRPQGKDWNDDLRAKHSKAKTPTA